MFVFISEFHHTILDDDTSYRHKEFSVQIYLIGLYVFGIEIVLGIIIC